MPSYTSNSSWKRNKKKPSSNYNLRSNCDGQECDKIFDLNPSYPPTQSPTSSPTIRSSHSFTGSDKRSKSSHNGSNYSTRTSSSSSSRRSTLSFTTTKSVNSHHSRYSIASRRSRYHSLSPRSHFTDTSKSKRSSRAASTASDHSPCYYPVAKPRSHDKRSTVSSHKRNTSSRYTSFTPFSSTTSSRRLSHSGVTSPLTSYSSHSPTYSGSSSCLSPAHAAFNESHNKISWSSSSDPTHPDVNWQNSSLRRASNQEPVVTSSPMTISPINVSGLSSTSHDILKSAKPKSLIDFSNQSNHLTCPTATVADEPMFFINGELKVKTVTYIFKEENDRLVVDSQTLIMPKEMTEEQLNWHQAALAASTKTYQQYFSDGEQEMELMDSEIMVSRNVLFLRRNSKMTLFGETNIYSHHPMDRIRFVQLGEKLGYLCLEDLYSATRTSTDSISRREAMIISFGREKLDSEQLQKVIKTNPLVQGPEDVVIYLLEQVKVKSSTMVVTRDMRLIKELWKKPIGWEEKIVKEYSLNVLSDATASPEVTTAMNHSPITPQIFKIPENEDKGKAGNASRREQLIQSVSPGETRKNQLDCLSIQPKNYLMLKKNQSAQKLPIELKNEGLKRVAWWTKTTCEKSVKAVPPSGILEPGATVYFEVTVYEMTKGEKPTEEDRFDVVWTEIEPEVQFDRQLFFKDGIVTSKKVLIFKYA